MDRVRRSLLPVVLDGLVEGAAAPAAVLQGHRLGAEERDHLGVAAGAEGAFGRAPWRLSLGLGFPHG